MKILVTQQQVQNGSRGDAAMNEELPLFPYYLSNLPVPQCVLSLLRCSIWVRLSCKVQGVLVDADYQVREGHIHQTTASLVASSMHQATMGAV